MPTRAANLVNYLKRMGSPYGCRALHCHVSGLPKSVRTRDNLVQAVQILGAFDRRSLVSKLFLLNNLDIVYVCFNLDAGLLRQAGSNIHKVFGREPVTANAYGGDDFATIVDLAGNDTRLLAFAETLAASLGGEPDGRPAPPPAVMAGAR